MPCWYWDKKDLDNCPSRLTGVPAETVQRYRKEGAKFIYKLVVSDPILIFYNPDQDMRLHHDTFASAAVFYHRFYQIHSFKKFNHRYVTATCCLFLAGKVEETPKKCKDLIKAAKTVLSEPVYNNQFGVCPNAAREEVMAMERVLLQTIKFDFNIEHPYKFIIQYAEKLKSDFQDQIEDNKMEEMVQQSWNFTNDSMFTSLCLQWEPQIIAICMIYLAGKIQKIELLGYKSKWWEKFVPDLERDLIESVCHQVLDIYSGSKKKTGATPAKTPAKRNKLSESSPNDVTPAKKSRNTAEAEGALKEILSSLPQDQLRQVMKNAAETDRPVLQTPVKTDPPPVAAPITPVAPIPAQNYYGQGNMSHSNPNTPIQQRTQRHQNLPKFSTPQPGRHGGPPGGQWPPNPGYQQPKSGGYHHGAQQNNQWPDQQGPGNHGHHGNRGGYGGGGPPGGYHRQNTYPANQRGGHQGGHQRGHW